MGGLAADDVHVGLGRADVLGRDVPPRERFDEPAVGAEKGLRLGRARVADDHRLAATEVEPGRGRLVGHALRETEHVLECGVLGLVRVEAGAAERGPESGGVDGDDRPQAALAVMAIDDLLVVVDPDPLEELHSP